MKRFLQKLKVLAAVSLVLLCICINSSTSYAAKMRADSNCFNVMVVLDASNSMNYTDPEGLRYEAVRQFTNLLTERGNYLGGIVFSNQVEVSKAPQAVSGNKEKREVTDLLASVMSTEVTDKMGYTNIGEALTEAINLLAEKGNKDLPSVIVFLSDGNTEMPTEEEQMKSLDQKAAAIQQAREQDIRIYTVCLNANQKADSSEMEQISHATGGKPQEVEQANDLAKVFRTFYSLIYGTSAIPILKDEFPKSGILKTEFEVPGFGVEEVNIVIDGMIHDALLQKPDKSMQKAEKIISNSVTLLKITDALPGKWILTIKGDKGNRVGVDMIYNSRLSIAAETDQQKTAFTADENFQVKAVLKAGNLVAERDDEYKGYHAFLHLMDAYGKELKKEEMPVANGRFEAECQLEEGVYYMKVALEGNGLKRTSRELGPLRVSDQEQAEEPEPVNTPPQAVEKKVKQTVYVWPIKGGRLQTDLTQLATDEQDDTLVYQIVSSAYTEGTDYQFDGKVLTMDHFSLTKGSFDIKAIDSGGLFCRIELMVTVRNVGVMAMTGLGVLALAGLVIAGIMFRIAITRPFGGMITVTSYVDGERIQVSKNPGRGRCRLSAFRVRNIGGGISYVKSYFHAVDQKNEKCVRLKTNVPVYYQEKMTNDIKVKSGSANTVKIYAKKGGKDYLAVKFESRMRQQRAAGGRRRAKRNAGSVRNIAKR